MNNKTMNADNLKNVLWDTLNKIKEGSITPEFANSIASQSREIMRVVKTQVLIANLPEEKASKFNEFR